MAYEDFNLSDAEKQSVMLANLYPVLPENIEAALVKAIKFLDGGECEQGEPTEQPRVYSFSKDANLIYAAFRQTHGIDLSIEKLHWWKFLALFMDLGADTGFSSLVNLRHRVKSGKATAEERRAAHEMGERFQIPEIDDRSIEEIEEQEAFLRLARGEVK